MMYLKTSLPQKPVFWILVLCVTSVSVFVAFTEFYILTSADSGSTFTLLTHQGDHDLNECTSEYTKPHSYSQIKNTSGTKVRVRYHLNPPINVSNRDRKKLNDVYQMIKFSKNITTRMKALVVASEIIQDQLYQLQNPKFCGTEHFICGHTGSCGLGCQIHQRIGCLIISYALGMPVIHDESGWPYNESWSDVFLPLGSYCPPGNDIYRFNWNGNKEAKINREIDGIRVKGDWMEYPLKDGIPLSKDLAEVVELSHPNPILWLVGQFIKFGLRLNPQQHKRTLMAMSQINFQHPIVGIHVRRTDKQSEHPKSRHEISEYVNKSNKYFESLSVSKDGFRGTKNIFISSDDTNVLNETRKRYSTLNNWNIIGFDNRITHSSEHSRKAALQEIVVDLFLLSECDFVVCGFSSNLCSLLLEMSSHKYLDAEARVDGTLDRPYSHTKHLAVNIGKKIIRMCGSI